MRDKILQYVFLFTVLFSILLVAGAAPKLSSLPDPRPRVLSLFTNVPNGFVKVIDIVDGDTIVVDQDGSDKTVRLLGVDTPEVKDPKRPVQCFGHEASDFTKQTLTARVVRLETDATQGDMDKYGRLLRYVYLEDGTTINARLVFGGYAFSYDAYPTQMTVKFDEMEQDAKENKRGLWGACTVTIKNSGKSKSTQAVTD